MKRARWIVLLLAACGAGLTWTLAAEPADENTRREKAQKLQRDGNFKEAYGSFSSLALDAKTDAKKVGEDLNQAVQSLQRLNRRNETDALREKVIATHAKNWRLLWTAAQSYMSAQHYGFIISGEFRRGPHRGGGQRANSYERDPPSRRAARATTACWRRSTWRWPT